MSSRATSTPKTSRTLVSSWPRHRHRRGAESVIPEGADAAAPTAGTNFVMMPIGGALPDHSLHPAAGNGGAAPEEIHVLVADRGLGCDGETIALTGATQPSIEDLVPGRCPACPRSIHNRSRLRERRRVRRAVPSRRPRRDRPVHPGGRRLDPRRERTRRRLLGDVRHRSRRPASRSDLATGSIGSRRAPGRSWPSAPARPTAASTRWRATRPAAWGCPTTSARTWNSTAGIPLVCVPGLPDAAGQPDRDAALPARQVVGPRADDSARRRCCARPGCSGRRCTRAAIAAATTNRPSSPTSTDRRSASSSSAAGARSCSATSASAAGWAASAAAPTSAASASAAPCPGSPTSSSRSWISRPARCCRLKP